MLVPMGVLRGVAATFSGRGVNVKSGLMLYAKPDITAPGVNIRIPGNKEKTVTGTSFATPMVTGAAAMLMEWGIVKGNDQYMYGEKLKAYLINGATRVGMYGLIQPEAGENYALRQAFPSNKFILHLKNIQTLW